MNKQVVVAGREIGLAVNGAKKEVPSALWLVTRLQHRVSVADKSVETVAKFAYLGIRTQNCTHEEIKKPVAIDSLSITPTNALL